MSVLWYLVPPGYCETDVLGMYRVLMMCVTMGGGSFALCLFPSGQAYVTKMKGIAKEFVPPVLLPFVDYGFCYTVNRSFPLCHPLTPWA